MRNRFFGGKTENVPAELISKINFTEINFFIGKRDSIKLILHEHFCGKTFFLKEKINKKKFFCMNNYAISSAVVVALLYVFSVVTSTWTLVANSDKRNVLWKFSVVAIVFINLLYIAATILISYI